LPRALNALVCQTRRPDEVILVDDASTDGSVAVMERYAEEYPFIKIVRNPQNMGAARSADRGLMMVAGEYVHWSASDDYMLPGFVGAVMEAADRHNAGAISTPLYVLDEACDDPLAPGPPQRNTRATVLCADCPPGLLTPSQYREHLGDTAMSPHASLAPSTIYRTELVRRFGGWLPDLGMHGCTFILRACALHGGYVYCREPLYTWVWRRRGLTASEQANTAHIERICRRHSEKMGEPPFDALFSQHFRERWDRETEAELARFRVKPPLLSRIFRR
jgi:glycosyltransferase involved in cell wall biosynthesis